MDWFEDASRGLSGILRSRLCLDCYGVRLSGFLTACERGTRLLVNGGIRSAILRINSAVRRLSSGRASGRKIGLSF